MTSALWQGILSVLFFPPLVTLVIARVDARQHRAGKKRKHSGDNPTGSMTASSLENFLKRLLALAVIAGLTACATAPAQEDDDTESPTQAETIDWAPALQGEAASVHWQRHAFPGKKITEYTPVQLDGRQAMRGEAHSSASMLRQKINVPPEQLGQLRFSWKVPALIKGADLTVRETDDSPVRVILAFDGDRSKFSTKNAMISELAMTLTGEPLPYATLMYVWGNHSAPGTVVVNTRTDRIRKLVLESGPAHLNRWQDHERDIRADYEQAFGEAPGALVGIGIMTDGDNTRQHVVAWYGPLTLLNRPRTLAAD